MVEMLFQQEFARSAYVSTLAAGAKETHTPTIEERGRFGQMNYLLVTNRDAVDIKVILDDDANNTGNILEIQAGASGIIKPELGILFSFVSITNVDSATAVTANKILVRMAKYTLVDQAKLGLQAKKPGED